MCGIAAVVGSGSARQQIMRGLEAMLPRGTDSAGLLLVGPTGEQRLCKSAGRPAFPGLKSQVDRLKEFEALSGLGHIRWATQGKVTEANAHPHLSGYWTIVHNGNVDHVSLEVQRASLAAGLVADDATDTSILVTAWSHFAEAEVQAGRMLTAATLTTFLAQVHGTNAFVLLDTRDATKLFVAVQGAAELYVAAGKDGAVHVVSSPRALDGIATTYHTIPAGAHVFTPGEVHWPWPRHVVDMGAPSPSLAGYEHIMEAELGHVPEAVRQAIAASKRRPIEELLPSCLLDPATAPDEVVFLACGSSLYAAETMAPLFEASLGCPVSVVDATAKAGATVRLYGKRVLLIVLSQSGTTSDTLMALERCRNAYLASGRGTLVTIGVHNNPMGALAHRVDVSLYTHTGEERATASTMAFFGQCATLLLLLHALERAESVAQAKLERLLPLLEDVRVQSEAIRVLASSVNSAPAFLLLALGTDLPAAEEGALKLKEIAYVMTEAMAAGNLKHGPLALMPDKAHVIVLAPKLPGDEARYDRLAGATKDVLTREGHVTFFTTMGNTDFREQRELLRSFFLPLAEDPWSQSLLLVYALQFLAYHLGTLRGYNVDNPRNLAKTVTVE